MNSRTHLMLSLLIGIILLKLTTVVSIPALEFSIIGKILFSIALIMGTMFPDVDHVFDFLQHRGITHTIYLPIISFIIAIFAGPFRPFFLGFSIGYFSHLLGDMITLHGIHPVYPLRYRISWGMKSGGLIEKFILVILVFLILFIV